MRDARLVPADMQDPSRPWNDVQCALALGLFVLIPAAAWLQHAYSCLMTARWGLLLGGTVFYPLGVLHGIGHWAGWWS